MDTVHITGSDIDTMLVCLVHEFGLKKVTELSKRLCRTSLLGLECYLSDALQLHRLIDIRLDDSLGSLFE